MTLSEATTLFEAVRHLLRDVLESAARFRDFAGNPEGRAGSHAALVQGRERASANRAAVLRFLGQSTTFWRDLRPVGRLIEQVRPVPSLLEETAARMKACRIGRPPAEVLELARCVERAASVLEEAADPVEQFDASGMANGASRLRAVIDEADGIGSRGLEALFGPSADPLEVLKLKDLYHGLGDILRRFQIAANLIEDMAQGAE